MNRRELIKNVAIMMGGTVVGGSIFLNGCKMDTKSAGDKTAGFFDTDEVSFLNEVADTIIPTTNTPGAKAAKVGEFMSVMVADCYEPKDQKIFKDGLGKIDEEANNKFKKKFMELDAAQKKELLTALDKQQKEYGKTKKEGSPAHYFGMMKDLTLLGYFTSEIGATQALRHVAVPGKYEGCVPYKKGDRAWSA